MKWILWIFGSIAALLIVGFVTLLLLGMRTGAGTIHATATVHATPEQVWPWLTDGDKLKQWVSWMVEMKKGPGPDDGVGATHIIVMKDENNGGQLMEVNTRITAYNPPNRLTLHQSSMEAFDGEQSYTLAPGANGTTTIAIDSKYRFSIFFARLMEPLITRLAQQKADMDVARLKTLLDR